MYHPSVSFRHIILLLGIVTATAAISADAQITWQAANNGLNGGFVEAFGYRGDGSALASASEHLYHFDGTRWERIHSGLAFNSFATTSAGTVIAGREGELYRSTDGGMAWSVVRDSSGLTRPLRVTNDTIIAATYFGIILSTDDGLTWAQGDSSLLSADTQQWQVPNGSLFKLVFTEAYNDAEDGLWRSTDEGSTWQLVAGFVHFFSTLSPPFMSTPDGTLWLCTGRHVFRSTNNGDSWEEAVEGMDNATVQAFGAGPDGELYAQVLSGLIDFPFPGGPPVTYFSALFRTTDDGGSWQLVADTLYGSFRGVTPAGVVFVNKLEIHETSAGRFLSPPPYFSTDKGETWSTFIDPLEQWISSIVSGKNGIVVATGYLAIFVSPDGGRTWSERPMQGSPSLTAITPVGSILTATSQWGDTVIYHSLQRSTDLGVTWHRVDEVRTTLLATVADGSILRQTTTDLRRSTDDGITWNVVRSTPFSSLIETESGVLFAGENSGNNQWIWRSTDHGANWSWMNTRMHNNIVSVGQQLFGTSDTAILHSTDNGLRWAPINSGLPQNGSVDLLAASSRSRLFATILSNGVYRADGIAGVPSARRQQTGATLDITGPNASTGIMAVHLVQPSALYGRLTLHDLTGRTIATLHDGLLDAGRSDITVDVSGLARGVYLLVFSTVAERVSHVVVVQ